MNNNNNHQQHINDDTNQNNQNLSIAKQLFDEYLKSCNDPDTSKQMVSILSTTLPVLDTTTTTTTTVPSSSTTRSVIESFIQLIFHHFGINNDQYMNTTNDINNINTNNTTNLNNLYLVIIRTLFRVSLFTNSPAIIDIIIPYLNFDFTTLNIPHDQHDLIQLNFINGLTNTVHSLNHYILQPIIDATEKGHYKSIQHLIEKYNLSPTIPIYDYTFFHSTGITNILFYATFDNNHQLIEYLLPLCIIPSTTPSIAHQKAILNIIEYGHLDLIKLLQDELHIDLVSLDTNFGNIVQYAAQSPNVELLDYIIKLPGINHHIHPPKLLLSAFRAHQWDIMKYLVAKYNIKSYRFDTPNDTFDPLYYAFDDKSITPDIIDYIITTFGITEDDINFVKDDTTPVHYFQCAKTSNYIPIQHLVQHYNANPKLLFHKKFSLLAWMFTYQQIPSLSMLEYFYELGVDVNYRTNRGSILKLLTTIRARPHQTSLLLSIFKSLLEHNAVIDDIHVLIKSALVNKHWAIVQYMIETYQSQIIIRKINLNQPLLHYLIISTQPSLDLIKYLLSSQLVDINSQYQNQTAISRVMTEHFNFDIIQLLIQYGATVTIDEWVALFQQPLLYSNPYTFLQCVNYFKTTFNFDLNTLSSKNTTPLLEYTHHQLNFHYTTIINNKTSAMSQCLIYQAMIVHYQANVNIQTGGTNNTVLHNLATNQQLQLIQFTLLNSIDKANIYLVNSKGETFLHNLLSNGNTLDYSTDEDERLPPFEEDDDFSNDDDEEASIEAQINFENLLNILIDLL